MPQDRGKGKLSKPSQHQGPDTLSASRMLTHSEIEQLRQNKKDANVFFQKRFAHLKTKKNKHQGTD